MNILDLFLEISLGLKILVIVFFILFIFYLYQVIFRLIAIIKKDNPVNKEQREGVSIIITSHNNSELLQKNLPSFLMQNYDNFEVIVVDECSEDDTQDVLANIEKEYPELKYTRIYPDTKFRFTKKLAINIGVKAAKNDILLFSEISCRPASINWVKTIESYYDKETVGIIGFSNYKSNIFNFSKKHFFRLLRFIKWRTLSKKSRIFFGDGCNLSFRKSYYNLNRGFSGNSQSYLGYDYEVIRGISRLGTVKVIKDTNAFVIVDNYDSRGGVNEISYYYAGKMKLPFVDRFIYELDMITRLCFYCLSFYLILKGFMSVYVISIMSFMIFVDFITLNIYSNCLKQGKVFLIAFITSTVGFAYRGYCNGLSFFNRRKWG